jgi:flagellar biosynthetic protein FliS
MTLAHNLTDRPVPAGPVEIPEHLVVLLLEAGQRFLLQIEEAIRSGDPRLKEYFIKKVLAILDELHRRLNHAQGGELVDNLIRLYDWWRGEILDAGALEDTGRLSRVRAQMGDIRQAWEHVLFRGEGLSEGPEL